jgi:hypothetical protein
MEGLLEKEAVASILLKLARYFACYSPCQGILFQDYSVLGFESLLQSVLIEGR